MIRLNRRRIAQPTPIYCLAVVKDDGDIIRECLSEASRFATRVFVADNESTDDTLSEIDAAVAEAETLKYVGSFSGAFTQVCKLSCSTESEPESLATGGAVELMPTSFFWMTHQKSSPTLSRGQTVSLDQLSTSSLPVPTTSAMSQAPESSCRSRVEPSCGIFATNGPKSVS